MRPILKVGLDDMFAGLIRVTYDDGAEIRYLPKEGLLHPGRPWTCLTPDGDYRVLLFMPFGEAAPPTVLSVTAVKA